MKCPNCSSTDTIWKAKAEKWECNSCEERFDGKSCPHCNSQDVVWKSKAGEWECSSCEERFSDESKDLPPETSKTPTQSIAHAGSTTAEEILALVELATKYREIEEELNEEWDEKHPKSCEVGDEGWDEENEKRNLEKEAWLKSVRDRILKKKGLNPRLSIDSIWDQIYTLLNKYTQSVAGELIDFDQIPHPGREGDVFDHFYERFDQIEQKLAKFSNQTGIPELIFLWYQIIIKRDWHITNDVRTWILGQFYCSGFGCLKSFSKGEKYFESIASKDPKFAFELSKYYLLGSCTPLDKKVMWEFEAFNQTMPLYYKTTTDFPVNLSKSLKWFFLSLKDFDPYLICNEYLKLVDKKRGIKLFKEIHGNTSFESQYLNAIIYFTGAGDLEIDNKKGSEIIQNELRRGNYYAQYSMALINLNRTPPNYVEAEKLLKAASDSNYFWAKRKLEELMKQKPMTQSNSLQENNLGDSCSAKSQGFLKKLFGG